MSRASEYAKAVKFAEGICPKSLDRPLTSITEKGELEIYLSGSRQTFTPAEALALADWILDTFGEPNKLKEPSDE